LLEQINSKRSKNHGSDDLAQGAQSGAEAEVVSSLIRAQGQRVGQEYFRQSAFHLELTSSSVEVKVYQDDLCSEDGKVQKYTSPLTMLASASSRQLRLDVNALPYETVVEVELG